LYLFGGHRHKPDHYLNDLWGYNINTGAWKLIRCDGDIPSPRDRHTFTCVSNKLYLFGGCNGSASTNSDGSEFLDDFYVFDIETSHWTRIPAGKASPEARYEHCASEMGKNFLVISGGKCKSGGLFDIWMFDTESRNGKWCKIEPVKSKSSDLVPRWGHSAVSVNKKLVFFGGWNGRFCFNDVIIVDFSNDPFKYMEVHRGGEVVPSIRTFHGSAMIGREMVLVAGRNMSKRLCDTYRLDLSELYDDIALENKKHKEVRHLQDNLPIPKHTSQLFQDSQKKKISKDSFNLSTTLGTGSFGRVRLCQYKASKQYFAMKILRKTRVVEMKQENHIKWEQKILSSIRHPFIVNLESTFQDKYFLYLVLELVQGGEFFTLLKRAGKLGLPHCAFYSSQIVLVFQFLHHNKIVYRDLKPENLLIGYDGYLKLTDFGFAKKLDKPYRTWTLCGTPEYIAPEILLNRGHSFSVDWWALGILLFEMFSGNPPFVDDNPMRIYQKILNGAIQWPVDTKTKQPLIPKRAKSFISALLTKKLGLRLGNLENRSVDVMKHEFFRGVHWKKVLEKSIKKVPWKPELDDKTDTKHFDDYEENTDTEDQELDNDPFYGQF
jgi:serine/threonine protein kinase